MRFERCVGVAVVLACSTARADDTRVKLEVRGDANATVEQAVIARYPDIAWRPLCTTPCVVHVRGDATVRVKGDGFPSAPVALDGHDAVLRAEVPPATSAPASSASIVTGSFVLAYSAVALVTGLGLELSEGLTICFAFDDSCHAPNHTTADALVVSSGVAAVVGAVILGVGFELQKEARATLSVSARGVSLDVRF